jgi:hypothetical protein
VWKESLHPPSPPRARGVFYPAPNRNLSGVGGVFNPARVSIAL